VEFICRHWFSNYRRFMNIHPNAVDAGFTTGSYCWLCFIHLCLSASVSFRYLSWYVLAYKYVVQQNVWLETSTQQTIINIQRVLLPIQQLVLDSKKSIWVTPWSGVLEKLVKRFVTPHGKRRFITGFTKPRKSPRFCKMFCNMVSFEVVLSFVPLRNSSHFVGCPRQLIQYIRSYSPYWRPFLHPQPEKAPCRGKKDTLNSFIYFLNFTWMLSYNLRLRFTFCLFQSRFPTFMFMYLCIFSLC
jgi:hypothetical protein